MPETGPAELAGNQPGELADQFLALNEFLFRGGDRDAALQRLVALAVAGVPGCDHAAVTSLPGHGRPRSLAVSDDLAGEVDQLQYELGDGPCLSSAADSGTSHLPDTARDDRWPAFAAAAHERTPVRTVLSFRLAPEPQRAALNLYGERANGFDGDAMTVAALFAAHARVFVLHAASAEKVANLGIALASSRQIGAAVGILMNVHKITAEEGFDRLRVSSQRLHRKLQDLADEVTRTGALPET